MVADFVKMAELEKLNQLTLKLDVAHFRDDDILFAKEFVRLMAPIAHALDLFQGDNLNGLGLNLPTVIAVRSKILKLENLRYCEPFAPNPFERMENPTFVI